MQIGSKNHPYATIQTPSHLTKWKFAPIKTTIMKTTKLFPLAVASVMLAFTGCGDKDDPVYPAVQQFDGSQQSVESYVTPELLATMEGLGLNVNLGNTPPAIAGDFMDSPNILESTNISNDTPGSTFADTLFHLENFNALTNTIGISYTATGTVETSTGIGAVVSGHDQFFTVMAKQKVTHDAGTADSIMMVSGELTDAGIVNFQFAIFMLDNHGLPTFIANNTGRLFHDGDNLAAKQ